MLWRKTPRNSHWAFQLVFSLSHLVLRVLEVKIVGIAVILSEFCCLEDNELNKSPGILNLSLEVALKARIVSLSGTQWSVKIW